ncbi:MAG: FadR family transcriptional regulator [Firmicutes bacterium]|nr:FadR family transcriptional regulator [Bacillota bacterium]
MKQESKTISQTIIKCLQDDIFEGRLHEGDKLPPEREMAEAYGIGRPALREAMRSLELMGLVESRHGLGNYVVNHVNTNYFTPLALSFKLSDRSPSEILEMRCCLESFAACKAAECSTPMDIASLKKLMNQMRAAQTTSEKAALDKAFHFEIGRMSGNLLIYNTMENISYLLDIFIEGSVKASYFEGDSIENIYKEHAEIVSAVEKHDKAAASASMIRHLSQINLELIPAK